MKVLIINGPNLNMLGKRDKNHYGEMTLETINDLIVLVHKGMLIPLKYRSYGYYD